MFFIHGLSMRVIQEYSQHDFLSLFMAGEVDQAWDSML